MPEIFKNIVLYNEFPKLNKKINPLENGLMWLRGMDTTPMLIHEKDINTQLITL